MATIRTINTWSVVQQARLIGHTAVLDCDPFKVRVKIMAGNTSDGNFCLKVTPIEGSGLEWVSSSRITLTEETLKSLDAGCTQG